MSITRRTFLNVLGASGGMALAGRRGTAGATAADRVRIGVIGVRGRGTDLTRLFASNQGAEVAAICDIDPATLEKPLKLTETMTGKRPRVEQDFRRILDDKEIDAIVIATPDHWHALMAIMGCQAGKDVYVEKPVSHNIVEGRKMVEAARKYNRVVQAGTQRRSTPFVADAIAYVHSGALGKIGMVRAWAHGKRVNIGHGKPGQVPERVDYALWQGPAPDRPFYANRFHYNWHWFWNWGTGELGNNGIHCVDVARWGLNLDPQTPVKVSSSGGKYLFDDDMETPDTQIVTWEFPTTCLVYEHRIWTDHPTEGEKFGIAFYGEKGTLIIDIKGWRVEDGPKAGEKGADGQASHVQNFLDCVRSRAKPNAEIELLHQSTRLCHLGNIAFRTGKKLSFDSARERFSDDDANRLLAREYGNRFELPSQV